MLAFPFLATPAVAYCVIDPARRSGALLLEAERNPKGVLRVAAKRLATSHSREDAGWLWATSAVAHMLLDRPDIAAIDATRGLSAIRSSPGASARLQLEAIDAGASEDEPRARAGIRLLQRKRLALTRGSAADICLLDTIGSLQHSIDQPQAATRTITAAYRMTARPGFETQRAWLTMMMAAILMRAHDRDGALALNQEGVDLAKAHNLPINLANLLYQRGLYLIERKNQRGALAALTESANIAARLQGPESAAYAQMAACQANLELGNIDAADRLCLKASGPLEKTASTKKVSLLLARIALARHDPRTALKQIGGVIDGKAETATSTIQTDALEIRARARASLGDAAGAYSDLSDYLVRMRTSYAGILETQTAELRARMLADRKDAQNSVLRVELRRAAETSRVRQRLTLVVSVGSILIIGLLTYAILLGRRHRRRLLNLADTDFLTTLPNRRSVYRHCNSMDRCRVLSVALLDLDRFKSLNDQHGHAAGDEALQLFAVIAQSNIRVTDSIARWGGEEFLILLPDTTIEKTIEIVERIRQASRAIALQAAPEYTLTFSAGIASQSGTAISLDPLVTSADAALYRAKAAGRDRTMVGVSSASPKSDDTSSGSHVS